MGSAAGTCVASKSVVRSRPLSALVLRVLREVDLCVHGEPVRLEVGFFALSAVVLSVLATVVARDRVLVSFETALWDF